MYVLHTLALVLAVSLATAFGAVIVKREAKEMSNSGSVDEGVCQHRTPCAWAVYIPFTRRIDYYMKNTCFCETGKVCMRSDDDLSVSAYVYRCKETNGTSPNDLSATFPPLVNS